MKRLFTSLFLLAIFLFLPINNIHAQESTGIIVKIKENHSLGEVLNESIRVQSTQNKPSFTVGDFRALFNRDVVSLFSDDKRLSRYFVYRGSINTQEAINLFKKLSAVEYAEPDYTMQLAALPNDPLYPSQYHLPKMSAPQAWDKTTGSSDVIVAVIDSGVDYTHPDIAPNMWHDANGYVGYDFGENDHYPMDIQGHGTHIAGTIGSVGNNNEGTTGINWHVKIMAVKAIGRNTVITPTSTVASSIIYAADNGAKVINMSFGAPYIRSQTVINAINYAWSKGAVLVSSAGNEICPLWFPANQEHVIAAGATDQNDNHPGFSCTGDKLELTAPSVNIISIERGGGYTSGDNNTGTSYSAAMVSGAAALVFSSNLSYTNADVVNRIDSTADDLGTPGRDPIFGFGRINLARAVGNISNVNPTLTPTNTPTSVPTPTTIPNTCSYKSVAYIKDENGNLHDLSGDIGLRLKYKFTTHDGNYHEGNEYFNHGSIGPKYVSLDPNYQNVPVELILHYDRSKYDLQESNTYCTDNGSSSCVSAKNQTVVLNFSCGADNEYGYILRVRPIPQPTQPPAAQLTLRINVGEGTTVRTGQIIKLCYSVPYAGRFTFTTVTDTWSKKYAYHDDGTGDCLTRQIISPYGKHTYQIEMDGQVRETYLFVTRGYEPGNNSSSIEQSPIIME